MSEKKIYLITGGSSGIGLSCIQKLSEDTNNQVISFSRSSEKVKRALEEMGKKPENVEFQNGDVRDEKDCDGLANYLMEKYGKLHGLVNGAGVLTKGGIEAVPYDRWKYNLDVNLNGPYLLTQKLLPILKKASGASIVNISSVASTRPGTSVAYSVSKAGLDMLTEFLAGDLAPYKIRVNSINPGLIRTPLHLDNKIFETPEDYEEMTRKASERYPLGRIGNPEEVADLILYLLSEKASWITGSIFRIDGGSLIFNDLLPAKP